MKNVTIKNDRFDFEGGTGIMWYICTECEDNSIGGGDNYCCNCGAKITWKLEK